MSLLLTSQVGYPFRCHFAIKFNWPDVSSMVHYIVTVISSLSLILFWHWSGLSSLPPFPMLYYYFCHSFQFNTWVGIIWRMFVRCQLQNFIKLVLGIDSWTKFPLAASLFRNMSKDWCVSSWCHLHTKSLSSFKYKGFLHRD